MSLFRDNIPSMERFCDLYVLLPEEVPTVVALALCLFGAVVLRLGAVASMWFM